MVVARRQSFDHRAVARVDEAFCLEPGAGLLEGQVDDRLDFGVQPAWRYLGSDVEPGRRPRFAPRCADPERLEVVLRKLVEPHWFAGHVPGRHRHVPGIAVHVRSEALLENALQPSESVIAVEAHHYDLLRSPLRQA